MCKNIKKLLRKLRRFQTLLWAWSRGLVEATDWISDCRIDTSSLKFKLNCAKLLENIPSCHNPAELTDLETCFAIDHSVSKITWMIERQSYENTLSLVKSAWIWTIQRKFVLHLSIGLKVARDKVNQIAHVWKARGSLGTKNMAADRDVVRVLKERLFSALIRVFQRIWSVKYKR